MDHYARASCWHHSALWGRHRLSLSLLEILGMKPSVPRAKCLGKLCYLLVKVLNFARHVPLERRPGNMVVRAYHYR